MTPQQELAKINKELSEIDSLLSQEDYSPMGDDELQIMKYEAAANEIAEFDPEKALQWRQKAQDIRTTAKQMDVRAMEKSEGKKGAQAFKIQSALNSLMKYQSDLRMNNLGDEAKSYTPLIQSMRDELQKPDPDLQRAYINASATPEQKQVAEDGEGEVRGEPIFNDWLQEQYSMLLDKPPAQNKDGSLRSIRSAVGMLKNKAKQQSDKSGYDPQFHDSQIEEAVGVLSEELERSRKAEIGEEERMERRGREERAEKRQEFGQYKDFVPAVNSVRALNQDIVAGRDNPTNTQLAVSQLLKILSGTGVSDTERRNTLLSLTSPEFQEKYRSESQASGRDLIKIFFDQEERLMADITQNVTNRQIRDELNKYIPTQAAEWAERTQRPVSKQQKTAESDRLKRIREIRARRK